MVEHLLMVRWVIRAISRSSQCSMTGITKAVVCVIMSVGSLAADRNK